MCASRGRCSWNTRSAFPLKQLPIKVYTDADGLSHPVEIGAESHSSNVHRVTEIAPDGAS